MKLQAALRRLVLELGGAERLALVRIATGIYTLGYLAPRQGMFEALARSDPSLFDPVGLAHLLSAPLSAPLADGLFVLTLALGVAFTVGAWFRFTGPAFALALLALLSYRNSWSMVLHMHNTLVVHVALLAWARSAEAWSVDRRLGLARPGPARTHWAALWWVAAVTLVPYFLSGVAKVLGPEGWAWASGGSLKAQVAVNALRYHVLVESSTSQLFALLADQGWLFVGLGVFTLVVELGAPLVLFHPRLGWMWALTTWGMHVGIFGVMGIKFRHQLSGVLFLPIVLLCLRSAQTMPPWEGFGPLQAIRKKWGMASLRGATRS